MTKMIYLVQIGPVQSFIASARKVQDLAVGSTLLSRLSRAGVEKAIASGATMLFPVQVDGKLPQSVPHRFAFISEGSSDEVIDPILTALRERWFAYAQAVKNLVTGIQDDHHWQQVFDEQVTQWLNIVWAAVPYDEANHGASYQQVDQALAARKQFRTFKQVHETGDNDGIKCTQTASQSALNLKWRNLEKALGYPQTVLFRDNERLGSLALIKRLLPRLTMQHIDGITPDIREDVKQFQQMKNFTDVSTIAGLSAGDEVDEWQGRDAERYFAVLHMDGDKMGKALGQLTRLDEHQAFSEKLNQFADQTVPKITDNHQMTTGKKDRVVLIYAGGDDVLALAPVSVVLPYAEALRTAFAGDMADYGLHASAGISINYFKSPLDIALDTARAAEATAKEEFGRNAITIREATHSGNIRDASGKWVDDSGNDNIPFMTLLNEVREDIRQNYLSSKIGFDLRDLVYEMVPSDDKPQQLKDTLKAARAAEVGRIIKRRLSETLSKPERTAKQKIRTAQFVQLGESPSCGWDELANRIIMARFLAQEE